MEAFTEVVRHRGGRERGRVGERELEGVIDGAGGHLVGAELDGVMHAPVDGQRIRGQCPRCAGGHDGRGRDRFQLLHFSLPLAFVKRTTWTVVRVDDVAGDAKDAATDASIL